MAKGKITRKQLKEDEVRTFGMKLYSFICENIRLCLIVLAALVVVFISVKAYNYRQDVVLRKSSQLLTWTINIFENGLMETDQTKREAALNQAISYAEQLVDDFPKSKAARQAQYLQGNAYYFMNDFDRAISSFQQYIQTAQTNEDRAKGYVALGYSFEDRFFYNEQDQSILRQAEKAYDQAIEFGKETYIEYQALLCKARLLELRYKNSEAMEIYEKIIADREQLELKMAKTSSVQGSGTDEPTKRPQRSQEEMLSQQIKMLMDLFSFAKTAELNLDRLKGEKI